MRQQQLADAAEVNRRFLLCFIHKKIKVSPEEARHSIAAERDNMPIVFRGEGGGLRGWSCGKVKISLLFISWGTGTSILIFGEELMLY